MKQLIELQLIVDELLLNGSAREKFMVYIGMVMVIGVSMYLVYYLGKFTMKFLDYYIISIRPALNSLPIMELTFVAFVIVSIMFSFYIDKIKEDMNYRVGNFRASCVCPSDDYGSIIASSEGTNYEKYRRY